MPCKIYYFTLEDEQTKTEKLEWFKNTKLQAIDFQLIKPDKNNNWINLADENNGFDDLIPVCSKDAKLGKGGNAIFELFSLGVATNRDEWVYDFNKENLAKKVKLFCEVFEKEKIRWQKSDKTQKTNDFVDRSIKWTEELENHLVRNSNLSFDDSFIIKSLYRPFINKKLYFDKIIIHRLYQNEIVFGFKNNLENIAICFSISSRIRNYSVLATNYVPSLALYVEPSQYLPLYRYVNGERVENITDWALALFRGHYSTLATVEDLDNRTVMPTKQPLSRSSTVARFRR
jgi:predicted helicase